MDANSIKRLFDSLKPHSHGWRANLPLEHGTFFGHEVSIDFQTQPIPEENPPPPVSAEEKILAQTILTQFQKVIRESEQRFKSYNAEHNPNAQEHIDNPQIWICRDAIEEDGPSRWAFVIGAKGAPDFGWHIEFDGVACQEIWAGD